MTQLRPREVAAYALAAGFTGKGANHAVAVALAESGGRTDAVATNHDHWHSRDRGLWQINSHWHPEVSDAQAFEPSAAAAAAYRISHGGRDWSAWSTWSNGAAAAQAGRARLAVAEAHKAGAAKGVTPAAWHLPTIPLPGPWLGEQLGGAIAGGGGVSGLVQGGQDVAKSLVQLDVLALHAATWMANPHNWLRVVMVGAGAAAVLVALHGLASSGAAGSTAQHVADTTTKAAKAAATKGAELAVLA